MPAQELKKGQLLHCASEASMNVEKKPAACSRAECPSQPVQVSVLNLQVCKEEALESWQLYLVDWGYNTVEERRRAAQNPRIHVVSMQELQRATGCKA